MNENAGIRRTDLFLLKNVLLAIAAASLAFASAWTGNFQTENLLTAAAIAAVTFAAYQLASWHPVINNNWFSLSRKPGLMIGSLTLIAGIWGLLFLREDFLLLLIPGALTVLYYLRWPSGFLRGGIRSFFLIKNILVGIVWTFLTYNLVLLHAHLNVITWISRFLFIFILTLALDLRDIENDLLRKVRTVPGHFGFRKAKWLIILFTLLTVVILSFFQFPFRNATLITLVLTGLVILLLKPETGYWTYFFLLDGIMPLHALFILLLR